MARATGSYPVGHGFKSNLRYHFGPLVKRLRHRPFTAVTGVRFSHGSPKKKNTDIGVVFLRTQRQLYSPAASSIASQLYLDFVQVIFATRVLATNRISLQGNALKHHFCQSKNITLTKSAYHQKLSGSAHLLTTLCGSTNKKESIRK